MRLLIEIESEMLSEMWFEYYSIITINDWNISHKTQTRSFEGITWMAPFALQHFIKCKI